MDFTIEELHVFFQRAERLSRTLDPQQYMEFTECRQTNFSESLNFASLRLLFVNSAQFKQICRFLVDKKAGKFKEWLDCASLIDLKPNTPVMEIFSFLAYETVAQVSDN